MTTADLNGDHTPDIIIADYYVNQILINFGTGDGTFRPPVAIAVGTGPREVVVADLNGDGLTDLAVANQLSNDHLDLAGQRRRHVPRRGSGRHPPGRPAWSRATSTATAGPTWPSRTWPTIACRSSAATAMGPLLQADLTGWLGSPSSLAAADFNGDGRLDLAVASADGGDVSS